MNESSTFLEMLEAFINSYLPTGLNASPNTVKSYKYAFRLLIEYMYSEKGIRADRISFNDLGYDTVTGFLDWIVNVRKCSPSTKNQRLSALLSFSGYAQNRDFDAAAVFRAGIVRIPVRKAPHKNRSWFSREEMGILLSLPDDTRTAGLRDKVLLSTMYGSGARAQEICDLLVADIRFSAAGAAIELHGKGRKYRKITIGRECSELLCRFIKKRHIEHLPERHVFSSQTHEQMTVSCIEGIVKKYVKQARQKHPDLFRLPGYSPHSIRHSTATHMLEAGVPIMAIKNFLGHSSVQTTQIYAELSQNTVDKHLREWNEKWFPKDISENTPDSGHENMPDFLTP